MKKLFLLVTALLISSTALAQSIGVSYEMRSDDPKTGFGARFQTTLLSLPIVKLDMRVHASYFSESNTINVNTTGLSYSYDQEAKIWDAGVMAIARFGIPFPVKPYGGIGLGFESGDVEQILAANSTTVALEDPDLSNFTVNGLVGFELGIPIVKPFVEYRVAGFTGSKSDFNAPGRLQIGIALRF